MKVLIVDDEPLVRRSLGRIFERFGDEVRTAEDGVQGLEMWRQFHPDLVLLDVLMPGMSGPEVLASVGKSKATVYLMSAFAGETDTTRARDMGARGFIPKPFGDVLALVETLRLDTNRHSR